MATYRDPVEIRHAGGFTVAKKTATVVASGSSDDLFEITGGPVLVRLFAGHVTTAIAANTDFDIVLDPTDGGSDVTLASTLAVDSDVTGSTYTLNTTANGALVVDLDEAYNAWLATPIFLVPGMIELDVAGGTGAAGVVDWYCGWVPVDDAGRLTVAS